MPIEIRQVGPDLLPLVEDIPISFTVRRILDVRVVNDGLGGIILREQDVEPYVKDYDSLEEEGPARWPGLFDVSNWAFFIAFDGELPVGAAAVAYDTPAVDMLEGRKDLALLWDIRIHPDYRRRGIGTKLLQRAADWARGKGCKRLKIETQNINLAACNFYQSQGCTLGAIDLHGYWGCPEVAGETMLLWYLDL